MLLKIFHVLLILVGIIQYTHAMKVSTYSDIKCTTNTGTELINNNQCISDTEKGGSISATCQSDGSVLAYSYSDLKCKQIKYTEHFIGDGKTCNFVKADPTDPSDSPGSTIIDCSTKASTSSDVPTIIADVHPPSKSNNSNIMNLTIMIYVMTFSIFVLLTNFV